MLLSCRRRVRNAVSPSFASFGAGFNFLGENLEDVTAGRAILASPVDKGGPPWVCLHCEPKWAQVHLAALREHELQVEKENAIVAMNFEKAAQCRDMQTEVRRRLILLLNELSRNQ